MQHVRFVFLKNALNAVETVWFCKDIALGITAEVIQQYIGGHL